LSYAGPPATTDRGYLVASGGSLSVYSDLTLTGVVASAAGTFLKDGPANLIHSRLDTNNLTAGGYFVGRGTMTLKGGASIPTTNYLQTNRITGDLWIGYDQVNAGAVILTNTSLSISAWMAIDRGNGTVGSSSKVTLYDSLMTCGNFSMGYANAIVGNSSFPVLTLLGNSSITSANQCLLGEDTGADAQIIVAGNSRITLTANWIALGNAGKATMTLSNTARIYGPGDYNLGDLTGGDGTLNMYDNSTNLAATLFVGKRAGSVGTVNQYGGYFGRSVAGGDWRIAGLAAADNTSVGSYNLFGGILETPANFQIGTYGSGTWTQTGGSAYVGGWPAVARYPGSAGTMTVSGGVFNQTATGNRLIVAEEGTGTLTVSGSGVVDSAGGVSVGHAATGMGTVTLNGGRIIAPSVYANVADSTATLNFNGGVLQARANNATFVNNLDLASVLAGGAIIDTTNFNVTIPQPLLGDVSSPGGGLTKLGAGTLALSGANTYTGLTTVSNGTLNVNGSIPGAVAVKSGGTLGGNGTVGGVVAVEPGGVISAGTSIGSLTLGASPTLNGAVLAEVNRNDGITTLADLITVSGNPINYSGALVVTNAGANLVANDVFKLFAASSFSGTFTLLSQTPGQIVTWDTSRLTTDGTIKVLTAGPSIPTTPTNITVTVSGGIIQVSWPTNYTGWRLEAQTNTLSVGLSNNWGTWPGSTSVNVINMPIDPAAPTVFFRLVYP